MIFLIGQCLILETSNLPIEIKKSPFSTYRSGFLIIIIIQITVKFLELFINKTPT